MIANVSPASSCCEHTLNTLRYTDRVKEMKKDIGGGPSGGISGASNPGGNGSANNSKTKEDMLSRELMLARQSQNVTKIQLNQNTLMPKN